MKYEVRVPGMASRVQDTGCREQGYEDAGVLDALVSQHVQEHDQGEHLALQSENAALRLQVKQMRETLRTTSNQVGKHAHARAYGLWKSVEVFNRLLGAVCDKRYTYTMSCAHACAARRGAARHGHVCTQECADAHKRA